MSKNKKFVVENGKVYHKSNGNTKLIGDIFVSEGVSKFDKDNLPEEVKNLICEKERHITVVGIRCKVKIETIFGVEKCTLFKLGYTIKHPNDQYNKDFGIKYALRNAMGSHRTLIATSFSLLGSERCQNIVNDELLHIKENLVKYV